MIHIADTKVERRYGDFFIRQIHKFEEVGRLLPILKGVESKGIGILLAKCLSQFRERCLLFGCRTKLRRNWEKMRYLFPEVLGKNLKAAHPTLLYISTSAAGDTCVLGDILTKSPWLLRSSRFTRGSNLSCATSELHLRQPVTPVFFSFPRSTRVSRRYNKVSLNRKSSPIEIRSFFFFRESWTLLVKSNSPALHEKSDLWWISLEIIFWTYLISTLVKLSTKLWMLLL